MNRKEKLTNITVKQAQRNRIFYMVIQPIQGILQLMLWVYIWVDMPVDSGVAIMIIGLLVLQVIVWRFDVSGFYQSWRAQESKSKDARVINAQINLQAARYVSFQRMTQEELNGVITKSKSTLGMAGDEYVL